MLLPLLTFVLLLYLCYRPNSVQTYAPVTVTCGLNFPPFNMRTYAGAVSAPRYQLAPTSCLRRPSYLIMVSITTARPLERAMRGHLHALSILPFPHWSLRFYEIDVQSRTLKLWHDEAASICEAPPLRCTPIYLVDAATIEVPPPNTSFAARLVLTLCKGTAEQATVSYAHEERAVLQALQASILGLAVTVPATCTALAQSSALRLAAQRPAMQGWLLKRRDVMAGWRRRLLVLWSVHEHKALVCACTMHDVCVVHAHRAQTMHTRPRTPQAFLCAVAGGRRWRRLPRLLPRPHRQLAARRHPAAGLQVASRPRINGAQWPTAAAVDEVMVLDIYSHRLQLKTHTRDTYSTAM